MTATLLTTLVCFFDLVVCFGYLWYVFVRKNKKGPKKSTEDNTNIVVGLTSSENQPQETLTNQLKTVSVLTDVVFFVFLTQEPVRRNTGCLNGQRGVC